MAIPVAETFIPLRHLPINARRLFAQHHTSVYRKSRFEDLNPMVRQKQLQRLHRVSATQVTPTHFCPAENAETTQWSSTVCPSVSDRGQPRAFDQPEPAIPGDEVRRRQ